MYIKQGIVVTR